MAEAITTGQESVGAGEFELVLGPRQFASLGLVVLTVLAGGHFGFITNLRDGIAERDALEDLFHQLE